MKTLALLCSGGDAPGMNAALWALLEAAEARHWRCLGVREGLVGLLRGDVQPLSATQVLPWARRGGTGLASSRLADFHSQLPALQAQMQRLGIDGCVLLGGNGSLAAAAALAQPGCAVVGIPVTIDNDVADSEESIGFDSALNTALHLLDNIRDTAEAMPRLFALETLGGNSGFLAQQLAYLAGADAALLPEMPLSLATLQQLSQAGLRRKGYALLVASEGYPSLEQQLQDLAQALQTRLRLSRIGHAQRGGAASARDRYLARCLAQQAIAALEAKRSGLALWRHNRAVLQDFPAALTTKPLPPMLLYDAQPDTAHAETFSRDTPPSDIPSAEQDT